MRIIIYTGKGGVGKTSMAAATARDLAAEGKRTIVLSTDAAHSLSDSLDVELSSEPKKVEENLWAQEIDSLKETERRWGSVTNWFSEFMHWAKLDDIGTEELMIFPGFEELFSLLRVKEHVEGGQYDVIIIDCAPTGETLRLLSYPHLLKWWVRKIFPYEKRFVKVARPIAKVTTGLQLPDDEMMNSLAQLVYELEAFQQYILNPEITSVRIVVNPEKMVIAEARRSFTSLNLYGFHTDAVIVNKVLPKEVSAGYMSNWQQLHRQYETEIHESFQPLPIFKVPLMEKEVIGREMLHQVAKAAFSHVNCGEILYVGKSEEITKTDSGYKLAVALPFAEKEEIKLNQKGDELTLQVGSYRKIITLPRLLLGKAVQSAKLADGYLTIQFTQERVE